MATSGTAYGQAALEVTIKREIPGADGRSYWIAETAIPLDGGTALSGAQVSHLVVAPMFTEDFVRGGVVTIGPGKPDFFHQVFGKGWGERIDGGHCIAIRLGYLRGRAVLTDAVLASSEVMYVATVLAGGAPVMRGNAERPSYRRFLVLGPPE